MTTTALPSLAQPKRYKKEAFLYALGIAFLIFIPFIVLSKGVYVHYGDFNVQQIPFYQLAHKAVRSGNILWNWNTDLGVNFIGSYSFYLLFSPFFWLTLPFPNALVPYLMGPLLILKTACASLTAYLYLERFVKDRYYAVIGGLLYAFSGWMTFNIFFNHFHDVAVFFPLLLLAVEKLVCEDKKIFFALMVAVNAAVNYWFFVGEVAFVIIYVIIRAYSGGWGLTWKKFFHLGAEAVLGLLLAAVALLPSIMALSGNPRTDSSRLLYGWGMWIYWHNSSKHGDYAQRVYAILQSIIFPPELAARTNFFGNHGAEWASLSAWLPMFSISGVMAYFVQNKNKPSWLKKILAFSLFAALIPILNSIFVFFNNAYYARWLYMPILLMGLATIKALENSDRDLKSFRFGIKWTFIPATIFVVAAGLTPNRKDGKWVFGLAEERIMVWIWYAVVVLGLVLVAVCLFKYRYNKKFKQVVTTCLAVVALGYGLIHLTSGRLIYPRTDIVLNKALGNRGKFQLAEGSFVRSDIYDDDDNLMMYWEIPTIQAFHSIVPTSLMEFYPEVGVERSVASRPETDYYAIRSLLSVRWLFISVDKDNQEPMPGYSYYDTQNLYNIYENNYYIPMGFTYDYAITPDRASDFTNEETGNLLIRAMIIEPEVLAENEDIIELLPSDLQEYFGEEEYFSDALDRKESVVDSFEIDNRGFTATTDFESDELVFFSVPFEKGWSASVNGEPVEIVKANIGFMAVRAPKGATTIEFKYMTPGLITGGIITLSVATLLLVWWLIIRKRSSAKKKELDIQESLLNGEQVTLSWDEYFTNFKPEERKEILRQGLSEAENQRIIDQVENTSIEDISSENEKE